MKTDLESRAQAMLGECIAVMRMASKVLAEEGYPVTAYNLRETADMAEAIRWEGVSPKEDGE